MTNVYCSRLSFTRYDCYPWRRRTLANTFENWSASLTGRNHVGFLSPLKRKRGTTRANIIKYFLSFDRGIFFSLRAHFCHCINLMKFVLLFTLADNFKLIFPICHTLFSFFLDGKSLRIKHVEEHCIPSLRNACATFVRPLYVLVPAQSISREFSSSSLTWWFNFLQQKLTNCIYPGDPRVGAELETFDHMFFSKISKIGST